MTVLVIIGIVLFMIAAPFLTWGFCVKYYINGGPPKDWRAEPTLWRKIVVWVVGV